MKKLIKKLGAILTTFLLLGCGTKNGSNITNDNVNGQEEPESGISFEEFFCGISKIDRSARYKRAVITYTVTHTGTGGENVKLPDGDPFPVGTSEDTCVYEVTQDSNGDLTVFDRKEGAAPIDKILHLDYIIDERKTPLTIWKWEAYHEDQRSIDLTIYDEYHETFHIKPYETTMTRLSYFGSRDKKSNACDTVETHERTFNDEGFLTGIYSTDKKIYFDKDKNQIGTYEIECRGTVEYFEKETDISNERFKEGTDGMNYPNFAKEKIEYTIKECLLGSTPGANYSNGDPLPDKTFQTAKSIVEQTANGNSKSEFLDSTNLSYEAKYLGSFGRTMYLSSWLSYHDEKRDAAERAVKVEGEGIKEKFYQNPYDLWMKIESHKIPNSDVEGSFYGFEEYDRRFDENGLVTYECITEYVEIDGTYIRWDTKPKYYKGIYVVTLEAHITYEYE